MMGSLASSGAAGQDRDSSTLPAASSGRSIIDMFAFPQPHDPGEQHTVEAAPGEPSAPLQPSQGPAKPPAFQPRRQSLSLAKEGFGPEAFDWGCGHVPGWLVRPCADKQVRRR